MRIAFPGHPFDKKNSGNGVDVLEMPLRTGPVEMIEGFIVVVQSFVSEAEWLRKSGIVLWERRPVLHVYRTVLKNPTLFRAFFISVARAVSGTALGVFWAIITGFAVSRKDMIGRMIYINDFNLDDDAYATDLSFSRLGLMADRIYRVYEFWSEEYRGAFRDRFRASVPPNACRLYRISEARPHPWLLSTDMHVQQ